MVLAVLLTLDVDLINIVVTNYVWYINFMKKTKNKSTNIRINAEVLSHIKSVGLSAQKIIDAWIRKHYRTEKMIDGIVRKQNK